MKKKKARKPDAADRIASWANGWVDTREFRVGVAARIRRAIKAAETAERKRIEGYIHTRCIRWNPKSEVYAALSDVLTDIDHGSRPAAVRAAKEER